MGIGGSEIFLILLAVLIFFGADKIPELARGLGKGMREFKKAAEDIKSELNNSTSDVRKEVDDLKSELNKQTTDIKKEVEEIRDDIDKTDINPKPQQ
ncbi:MAG TPA: twin-arginine translocase TatA/TatE family subunit [Bacteroidales bacterium]|nr:twin-arginine translocase TatA/TatE family subunit [Bacteroidales bacterium]